MSKLIEKILAETDGSKSTDSARRNLRKLLGPSFNGFDMLSPYDVIPGLFMSAEQLAAFKESFDKTKLTPTLNVYFNHFSNHKEPSIFVEDIRRKFMALAANYGLTTSILHPRYIGEDEHIVEQITYDVITDSDVDETIQGHEPECDLKLILDSAQFSTWYDAYGVTLKINHVISPLEASRAELILRDLYQNIPILAKTPEKVKK